MEKRVPPQLRSKKIAILAADMLERVELEEPRKALEDSGAQTEIVSIHDGEFQGFEGEFQGFDHFEPKNKVKVDKTVEEVSVDDYDAVFISGGVGNRDQLRGDEIDDGIVTSCKPDDIPAFNKKMIDEIAEGKHEQRDVSQLGSRTSGAG